MRTALCISCDYNYIEGLRKVLYSLQGQPHDIVLISKDVNQDDLEYPVIIHRPMQDYTMLPANERFTEAVWYIFESLLLGYERVCWVGSDALVVGDLTELPTAPFSAVRENILNNPRGFCGGMVTIRPDCFPGLWDTLMDIAKRYPDNQMADQEVLNRWITENNIEVNVLEDTWDVTKRLYKMSPEWWDENKHRFKSIHYVGKIKPWLGDEPGYEALHKFWRDYNIGDEVPCAQ